MERQSPAEHLRVLHFADAHLGVEVYGKYNPETGLNSRLEDFTRSLNAIVDIGLAENVDIALFAGDAYKLRDPNQTHQRAFAQAMRRLTEAGIPVMMLVGNHDIPNTAGRAHALEIFGLLGGAGVTIFGGNVTRIVPTRRGDVLIAAMPYLTRSRVMTKEESKDKGIEEVAHLLRERYVNYLADLAKEADAQREYIALLMGHFTVTSAKISVQKALLNPSEPQVELSNVALRPFDYVAMGHVHKRQNMNNQNQPPVVYSGSIERVDFGESNEEKGCVIADVRKGFAEYRFVDVPIRRMHDIQVVCGGSDDPMRIVRDKLAEYPLLDSIVQVRYRIAAEKASLVRHEEIRTLLNGAHFIGGISQQTERTDAAVRSHGFADSLTPEEALTLYIDSSERLKRQKAKLLEYAKPIFTTLEQEEMTI